MYVLECTDERKSLYCGVTTDIDRRVLEHNNSKKGAKYTRARRPVHLLFTQEFRNRSEALKSEAAFKKLTREQKYTYMAHVCEKRLIEQIEAAHKLKSENNEPFGSLNLSTGSSPQ
jgi:putative endonuclease